MIKTLIAAHDANLVIGNNGKLPWRYPEDLKHFKKHTLGKVIIMGRGVFEELGEIPLSGRRNIVLTRTKKYKNVETFASIEEVFTNINTEEVFIIGGGVLYKETLLSADRLIITLIKKQYKGDTFFPEYRDKIGTIWKLNKQEDHDDLLFQEYLKILD